MWPGAAGAPAPPPPSAPAAGVLLPRRQRGGSCGRRLGKSGTCRCSILKECRQPGQVLPPSLALAVSRSSELARAKLTDAVAGPLPGARLERLEHARTRRVERAAVCMHAAGSRRGQGSAAALRETQLARNAPAPASEYCRKTRCSTRVPTAQGQRLEQLHMLPSCGHSARTFRAASSSPASTARSSCACARLSSSARTAACQEAQRLQSAGRLLAAVLPSCASGATRHTSNLALPGGQQLRRGSKRCKYGLPLFGWAAGQAPGHVRWQQARLSWRTPLQAQSPWQPRRHCKMEAQQVLCRHLRMRTGWGPLSS